jgi:hypothetical protein
VTESFICRHSDRRPHLYAQLLLTPTPRIRYNELYGCMTSSWQMFTTWSVNGIFKLWNCKWVYVKKYYDMAIRAYSYYQPLHVDTVAIVRYFSYRCCRVWQLEQPIMTSYITWRNHRRARPIACQFGASETLNYQPSLLTTTRVCYTTSNCFIYNANSL